MKNFEKVGSRFIGRLTSVALMAVLLSAIGLAPVCGSSNTAAAVTEALARRHAGVAKEPTHSKPAEATHVKSTAAVGHAKPAAAVGHAKPPAAAHRGQPSTHVQPALAGHGPLPSAPVHHSHPAVAAHAAAVPEEPKETAEATAIWTDLMECNRRFVAGEATTRELVSTRRELAKGQHPKVIVLTCSDSRVSPELLFDKNLGELFVIRTAGNVADKVALGSIEYAAEHLKAPVLVILGHEKCGAVTAAASGAEMPTDNLSAIVEKIAPVVKRMDGLVTGDRLISWAVEANVHQVANDMLKYSPIIREAVEGGKLSIITAKYDLDSGQVVRL